MNTQILEQQVHHKSPQLASRMRSWLSPHSLEDRIEELESRWMMPRGLWPSRLHQAFGHRTPRVDIIERDDEICVRAEMPGVNKENVEVNLRDDVLSISSCVTRQQREEEEHYLHSEISREEYHRTLLLPASVIGEKATASFRDGILEVVIPKTPGSSAKKIEIQ